MSSLTFFYSSMNAGKTLMLLKIKNDYEFAKKRVFCLTSSLNSRDGEGYIKSRAIPNKVKAFPVFDNTNVFDVIDLQDKKDKINVLLVDEVQFFTKEQIIDLCRLADEKNMHVMCYGLRTDSNGKLFEGSSTLLAMADKIEEVKNTCFCGKKATMTLRVDDYGSVLKGNSPQINIAGNDQYVSVCRKHWSTNTYE